MLGRYVRNFSILFAAFSMVLAFQSSVMAQGGANGGGNGGGNAGGNAGGNGPGTGGIEIDANGVLLNRMTKGDAALLSRARYEAAKASINKDLQKSSKLRKI